jgi:hypothetical protein
MQALQCHFEEHKYTISEKEPDLHPVPAHYFQLKSPE